jgi:N-hydroxyarylamine O-acetyltransferase
VAGLRDLDAYLARIGLHGRPGLVELHRAHAMSIPFENLDPANGKPASLDPGDLEDKLVARRRGGYCFEQNLLLMGALEALGYEGITPMLARVRAASPERRGAGGAAGAMRPRTHLLLRVEEWHLDVGFGGDGLLDPIPFGPGGEYEQAGWRYRVVEDGRELVLQMRDGDTWADQYGFVPEEAPFVDIETSNWFVSTWPNSPFVTGVIVGGQDPGVHRRLMVRGSATYTESTPDRVEVTALELEEVPGLLAARFGIEGVGLSAGGRLVI